MVALAAAGCAKSSSYRSPAWERPFRGLATSSVVVVEHSDFQCPACRSAQPAVDALLAKYGDQIRFEYHHFPLTQVHRFAFDAAVASECAADQGKFWEYGSKLFEMQPEFSRADLIKYAADLGLNTDTFTQCLDSDDPANRVKDDVAEAAKLKLPGTPTFFINGRQVGDWAQLEGLLLAAGVHATTTGQ